MEFSCDGPHNGIGAVAALMSALGAALLYSLVERLIFGHHAKDSSTERVPRHDDVTDEDGPGSPSQ